MRLVARSASCGGEALMMGEAMAAGPNVTVGDGSGSYEDLPPERHSVRTLEGARTLGID